MVLGAHKKSAEQIAVSPKNEAPVVIYHASAVPAVDRRNPVPGKVRLLVVNDMQIVVEKQQGHHRPGFDDRGAPARVFRRPMLIVRAE